jgi:hypothetical protein
MTRGVLAGAALGLLLLAAGTLLGTLRVLVAAPRLGSGLALALELPLMLALAWWASGRLRRRFGVASRQRRAMAAAALVVLFAGEAALAAALFGLGPAAWLAGFAPPAAWPGLAAQVAACLMPLSRRRGH